MSASQKPAQAAAYASVREQLIDEGYGDQIMRTPLEIRDTLAQVRAEGERLERVYRDLLSELDEADDEASLDDDL